MDALLFRGLRDMSLGLFFVILAAILLVLLPAFMLFHVVRRSLTA